MVGRVGRGAILATAMLLAVPGRTAALSCVPTTLLQDVLAAGGVFEGTIVARRPVEQPVPAGWPAAVPPPPIIGADRFELSLADIVPWRGASATTIRTSWDHLQPGQRYVFVAFTRTDGSLGIGACAGRTFDASRSAGLKAWVASLAQPADGGRIFGAVLIRPWGRAASADWPSIEGARVTARGPIVVEATTSATGAYVLSGLPDGRYALTVALPEGSARLEHHVPTEAVLMGDHAVVAADFTAYVAGTLAGRVVDQDGQPVAERTLYLYGAAPGAGDEDAFGLVNTDANGAFVADGVVPGRYLLTIQDPFEPAHAPAPTGGTEIVMGWGERVELPTFVVRRGEPIDVPVFTIDANGQPTDDEVQFQLLGPFGLPLRSGHYVETSRSGRFPPKLMRGVRYRFKALGADGTIVIVDRIIDGTPVRIVIPN